MIARWLSGKNRANGECLRQARRRWFLILMAIGLCVCVGKLTRISPMRGDKRGYIEAANWLRCNTSEGDVIALRDLRIAFYAEREGLTYGRNIPLKAKYVVEILDENQQQPDFGRAVEEKAWMWVGDKEANKRVVIYEFL
ncbi:MAG: hypothetical protein KAR47_05010 [Planctomycetes bacterium]|nr:hypothetical protein [Planctomycetota bacterium]